MCRVSLHVGTPGGSIENVVGGEVHQLRVDISAGTRNVAHRERIALKGCHRIAFRQVHLVVCGCVQDNGRIQIGQRSFHRGAVADIHLFPVESRHLVPARGEYADEFYAELSAASEDYDTFSHPKSPYRSESTRSITPR